MTSFLLLVLPLPFNLRRSFLQWISRSPLIANVAYFVKIIFAFVLILFIDAVNRMFKAEAEAHNDHHDVRMQSQVHARKFYAQRNMYLCGFTLFLSLILSRTYSLILDLLKNEQLTNVLQKQAENQSKEYTRLTDESAGHKTKLETLESDLKAAQAKVRDMETFKKQAEQNSKAYMELTDKYDALEKKSGKFGTESSKSK